MGDPVNDEERAVEIERVKKLIQGDEALWSQLFDEEREIRKRREVVFYRKCDNKRQLKRLLGLENIL